MIVRTHTFPADVLTPIGAYLALGTPGASCLLESVEHGGKLSRYSFVGLDYRFTGTFDATAHQLDDIRGALQPVRPGQAVYVASAGGDDGRGRRMSDGSRTDIHLGALALIERRAWWPFEFDNDSQQPMETKKPYGAMAERVGDLPDAAQAATADVCGFDYVLLTGADAAPALPPERFEALRRSGFAALYRIIRCHP